MIVNLSAAQERMLFSVRALEVTAGLSFGIEGTTSDPKFVPDVKAVAGKAISNKVGETKVSNPF
jgi:hypothetical protein